MTAVPRILRADAQPPITWHLPTAVITRLWWRHLRLARDAQAWALATAGEATLVCWAG